MCQLGSSRSQALIPLLLHLALSLHRFAAEVQLKHGNTAVSMAA